MQTVAPNILVAQTPIPVPQQDTPIQNHRYLIILIKDLRFSKKYQNLLQDYTSHTSYGLPSTAPPPHINQLVPSKHVTTVVKCLDELEAQYDPTIDRNSPYDDEVVEIE